MANPWSIGRWFRAGVGICAVAACVALSSTPSHAVSVVQSKNVLLKGSKTPMVQRLGGVNPAQTHRFTVIMKSPSATDAEHVATYFRHFGMAVTISPNNKFLHVVSTFSRSAAAGNTQFERVKIGNETLTRTTRSPQFPNDIAAKIAGTSMNPGPRMRAQNVRPQALVAGPQTGYGPGDLATVYNFNSVYAAGVDGKGEAVDIAACFNIDPNDIKFFQNFYGLPVKPVHVIHVDGTVDQFGDVPPPDLEPTLDVERVMAVAPNAKINLYVVPDCLISQFVDMFSQIASDGNAVAMSTSYGLFEADYAVLGVGDLLVAQSAALQGVADSRIQSFSASGDSGSWGDSFFTGLVNFLDVLYPASDPNVIAVGGTTIEESVISTRLFEYAWGGSGGGVSGIFPISRWQAATPGVASGLFKNLPDVSYVADGNTGAATAFIVNLPPPIFPVGGTSVSSPSWGGVAALIAENRRLHGHAQLGSHLAPALYAVRGSGGFTDITVGANGYFPARTGYDNVTGLGVPNGAKLIKALQ